MKICMVIKYPPIQGGVSAQSYWLAHGLARRGHQVHVVTNAEEVEESHRLTFLPGDHERLQTRYPDSHGAVYHYPCESLSPRLSHIPQANPMVSKLAGRAAQVIEAEHCDVVYAHYLEPYGVAAHLAGNWTGRPYVINHAGSDLDRLMKQPELARTYEAVLRGAARIVTRPYLLARYLSMRIPLQKLCLSMRGGPGLDFLPTTPGLAFSDLIQQFVQAGRQLLNSRLIDPNLPVIGFYGKIGRSKGTFDLVAALGRLRAAGHHFQLAALTMPTPEFRQALLEAGIDDCTWVFPFVGNWHVAQFVRACTCICFLERDFPIAIHGPIIPREVLACGTPLVLSGEIAKKQAFKERLVDRENVYLVDDPKQIGQLSQTLEEILSDTNRAATVGQNGWHLSNAVEAGPSGAELHEQLFSEILHGHLEPPPPVRQVIHALFPQTYPALDEESLGALSAQLQAAGADCDQLLDAAVAVARSESSPLSQVPTALDTASLELLQQTGPRFRSVDVLSGRLDSLDQVNDLIPVVHPYFRILNTSTAGRTDWVLVFKEANHNIRRLAVTPLVAQVLDMCSEPITVAELAARLGTPQGTSGSRLLEILQRLYADRVIIFNRRLA